MRKRNANMRLIKNYLDRLFGMAMSKYFTRWLIISVLIGCVAGVGSILFHMAIKYATELFLGLGAGYRPPSPSGEGGGMAITPPLRLWMIPVLTTLGGLISGLIVFKWAPEAEGHGTDAAIKAFHHKSGFIRKRVPLIKIIASAVTIGSGGSAGREGPVALVGGGFGSAIADFFKLSAKDRRIALTVGIGAGIGSIFKAPLGGAIISTEILYHRDFEVEALLPSFIASITGYSIFASWAGWAPIFTFDTGVTFQHPEELLGYTILGVACGLIGKFYGKIFYRTRDLFKKIPIPNYTKPALGGLIVGLIALFLPQVLGMGYGWLQLAIDGNFTVLPIGIMVGLIFGKIIATSLTVGSGGSGGIFAPGLFIGGMVGGSLWYGLQNVANFVPANPAAFVVVGMMALFGGIAKAPLAIMIMVSEMTGSYALLAPCMVSVVIAYFVAGKGYIYENQVPTKAESPAHRDEYTIPLLTKIKVNEVMRPAPVTISPDNNLSEIMVLMERNDLDALPVLEIGQLTGIVANLDIARVPESRWPGTTAKQVMTSNLIVGYADESLDEALTKMTDNNISHLPIIDTEHPELLIGMLTLGEIAQCYEK